MLGETSVSGVIGMVEGEKRGRLGGRSLNPYYEGRKYPEPTVCPRCDLVYRNGRWQVGEVQESGRGVNRSHCPACRREIDRIPGGIVLLSGSYISDRREEILNIVRNQAAAAAANRPLQRIMWIEDKGDAIEIATTDGHLATRIGKAIEAACKGTLSIKRGHEDQLTRVYWERKD